MCNATKNLDYAPIQVILTDALMFQFFLFDFSTMRIWRGAASRAEGYKYDNTFMLLLPTSEIMDDFLHYLRSSKPFLYSLLTGKAVVETIFDVFVSSYCYALDAVLIHMSKNKESFEEETCMFSSAKGLANRAHRDLRLANERRTQRGLADSLALKALDTLKER